MSRFRLVGAEAVRSLGANLSTTLAATVTILICMFLLGFVLALRSWADSLSHHYKNELLVKVYFCTTLSCGREATTSQMNSVRTRLETRSDVKRVTFVSKQDALKYEERHHPDMTKNLPGNPLPNGFNVVPRRGDDVSKVAASLSPSPPGVEKVDYGGKTAHRVLRVANVIKIFFYVVVVLLLGAAMLLIANTIRLSIFARRREIEVMKLVGATNWFVRGPFMLEGLICGLVGAIAAVILLLLGKELAMPAILGHVDSGSDVKAWPFELIALLVVAVSLGIGAAGSGLTIRRFLRV
jgi:cell division transport system permease protein